MSALLSVSDLIVSYGSVPAVNGVSLEIHPGELRVILGANGAGKTTIIKTILGLLKPRSGKVRFSSDHDLVGLKPHQIHRLGISWVPEGRQLWDTLSVLDNLKMGAYVERDRTVVDSQIGALFERFPHLRGRQFQLAGSLSGGEQQMVALARALLSRPKLILMDEPSLGLAPLMIKRIFELLKGINEAGTSILMVEQNARQALKIAHWAYLLEVGRIVESGPADEIGRMEAVQAVFLGGRA